MWYVVQTDKGHEDAVCSRCRNLVQRDDENISEMVEERKNRVRGRMDAYSLQTVSEIFIYGQFLRRQRYLGDRGRLIPYTSKMRSILGNLVESIMLQDTQRDTSKKRYLE